MRNRERACVGYAFAISEYAASAPVQSRWPKSVAARLSWSVGGPPATADWPNAPVVAARTRTNAAASGAEGIVYLMSAHIEGTPAGRFHPIARSPGGS